MVIRITDKCYMNCTHCMINSSPTGEHMEDKVFIKTLEFIKKNKPNIILVSGGEPTEHPKFFEYINKLKLVVHNPECIVVASNGMFLANEQFTKKISKLGVGIQVTNDKRFYPMEIQKPKKKIKNIVIVDKIQQVYPQGRARDNNLECTANAPKCFNIRSVVRNNANSLREAINILEFKANKFCTPSVNIDGTISIGESSECFKVGTVFDSEQEIYNNIKNFKYGECNSCGMEEKLPFIHKQILKY